MCLKLGEYREILGLKDFFFFSTHSFIDKSVIIYTIIWGKGGESLPKTPICVKFLTKIMSGARKLKLLQTDPPHCTSAL